MSKVITFSTSFPKGHPKAGKPTFFVEKLINSLTDVPLTKSQILLDTTISEIKSHTIRAGKRFKKGDMFSPRVWSGKPYNSTQLIICQDLEVVNTYDFKITTEDDDGEHDWSYVDFLGKQYTCYGYGGYDNKLMVEIAKNDGLTIEDFYSWFLTGRTEKERLRGEPKIFDGQIIVWDKSIKY